MLNRAGPFNHGEKDLNANLKIRSTLRGAYEGLKTLNEEYEAIERGFRRFNAEKSHSFLLLMP